MKPTPTLIRASTLTTLALSATSLAAQIVWSGAGTDDLWGNGANWVGGVSPSPGSTSDIAFAGTTRLTPSNNYTAFDDFRDITFSSGAGAFTLSGSAIDIFGKIENNSVNTQTISTIIAANSSFIEMNPVAGNIVYNASNLFLNSNQLRVWGDNGKSLTFGGASVISGTGTVAINQNSNVIYSGSAAHTYSGDTFINAGKLTFGSVAATANSSTINLLDTSGSANATLELSLGGGGQSIASPIVVRSGGTGIALIDSRHTGGANTFSGTLTLDKDVSINVSTTNATPTTTFSGVISGAGGINKYGMGTASLNQTETYSGATNVYAGTLALGSATVATGSILNTSSITVGGIPGQNGTLQLINSFGNADRITNTTGVTLNQNGRLTLTHNTATNTSETIGDLTLGYGDNIVSVSSAASRVTTLTIGSLVRNNNATALFRGTSLTQTVATNVARITMTDAGASVTGAGSFVGTNTLNNGAIGDATQALKIIPYLHGDSSGSGAGNNFVTYDSTLGLRVLTAAQGTTLVIGSTTAANPVNARSGVNITLTNASGLTVNSLLFDATASTLNSTGANPLTVNSGAVMAGTGNVASILGSGFSSLILGNGEGVVTVAAGGTSAALTINTPISVTSSGGLTKAGGGLLTLSAVNTYTGPTFVNQGSLLIGTGGSINTNSAITTHGLFGSSSTGTITQGTQFSASPITGTGGVTNTASGTLNLTAANTFTGILQIAGTVNVASLSDYGVASAIGARPADQETAIGNGMGLHFRGGTLQYTGSTAQSTNRQIRMLNGTGNTIDASGSNPSATLSFTYSGVNTNLFDTAGTRTLTLTGTNTGNNTFALILENQSTNATSLTKSGTGTWTYSGIGTYNGNTTVKNGILNLTGNRTATTGTIMVGDTLGQTGVLNQTGNLTAGGLQVIVGNSTGTGIYNLSAGTLTGTASGNRGVIIGVNTNSVGTFNLSGTGVLALGSSNLQVGRSEATGTAETGTNGTYNQTGGTATVGSLGIAGLVAVNNAGAIGNFSVTGGTFSATTFQALAGGDNSIATLTIGGTAQVTLPAFPTARGTGATATLTLDGGTLIPAAASAVYLEGLTDAFVTSNGAKIDVPTGRDITINQTLSNAVSQSGTFTKLGTGTLTLGGNNSYSGGTTVSAGTLVANHISAFGTGNVTVGATATLDLNNVAVANTIVNTAGGTIIGTSGSATITQTNGTLSGSLGGTITASGTVAGTPTINGTLKGTATFTGAVTINGTHAPGNSPGLQTFGSGLTYNSSSILEIEFAGNTLAIRGTDYDAVNITGGDYTVASGAVLKLIDFGSAITYTSSEWDAVRAFTIVDSTGGGTTTGDFILDTSLAGSFASEGGWSLLTSSGLNGGTVLTWTPVPEPSTYAALAGLAALALAWKRRRRA